MADGKTAPKIKHTDDPLAAKFTAAAKASIISTARAYSEVIAVGNSQAYGHMQRKHLKQAVSEFDKARQGEESAFVAATAPSLSKRQALFDHVLNNRDWLQIGQITPFVNKPEVLS